MMRTIEASAPRARLVAARVALAAALVFGAGGACGSDAPNGQAAPESAFRAFRTALRDGDHEAVWAFLGPETRAALERAAATFPPDGQPASPAELLLGAWIPAERDIASLDRVRYDEHEAVLRMTTHFGHSAEVVMRRVEDGWQIELGVAQPSAAQGAP